MQHRNREGRKPSRFEIYLRTGRRVQGSDIELKFNPWHDPSDGRFTFAGGGQYFAGGAPAGRATSAGSNRTHLNTGKVARAAPVEDHGYPVGTWGPMGYMRMRAQQAEPFKGGGGSFGGGGASGSWGEPEEAPRKPVSSPATHAGNESAVQKVLTGAATAVAMKPAITSPALGAAGYRPPAAETRPTEFRQVSSNGYSFKIDGAGRTREVTGNLTLNPTQGRSRSAQRNAGLPDRLRTDDGGHYIARRFNGPTEDFNHFAQDATFNRGQYARLENLWTTELRAGRAVWVDIHPSYSRGSRRPSLITVIYRVQGSRLHKAYFPNTSQHRRQP